MFRQRAGDAVGQMESPRGLARPLALAMARAFSRERQRRDALRQHVSPQLHRPAHATMR